MPVAKVVPAPVCCGTELDDEFHGKDKGVNSLEGHVSGIKKKENELYITLRPMIVTMKIFGMYYLDETTFKNTLSSKISFGYSVFVLIVLIGNLCINLPTIFSLTSLDHTIVIGTTIVWFTYTTCQGIAMFIMCFRVKAWRELFKIYEHAEDTIWNIEGHIHLKKRVYVYVIVCWAAIISSMGSAAYLIFNSEVFNNMYMITLGGKDPVQISLLKGVYTIFSVYLNAAWIVPVILSVMMNDLLSMNFQCFNKKLLKGTKCCSVNLSSTFGNIRDMHQRLIDITTTADTVFSSLAAMAIIFNVIIVCFVLYTIIYNSYNTSDPMVLIVQIFWLATAFLIIFINTGTCAWLKEEVGSIIQILEDNFNYIIMKLCVFANNKSTTT